MSYIAIRAQNLSKQYMIGTLRRRDERATEYLAGRLKSLFGAGPDSPDNTIWALNDVSFELNKGETIGVIGHNGSGKSTLLKLLARVIAPTKGRAEIYGRMGSLLEVGTGFHPELTGRENIFLNGAILGMKRAEIAAKFDEIVAFSEIGRFLDTPVKRYSSGMYTRLAFAVAAHLDPEILVVDEVLSVGDYAFQEKCLGKMQDIAGAGRTVIFVSHNLGAVRALCNRCILLEKGALIHDGPSETVVEQYIERSNKKKEDHLAKMIEADHHTSSRRYEGYFLHYKSGDGHVTMFCGDPMTLEFDIEAPEMVSETATGIGISIFTRTGESVVSMSSNAQAIPRVSGQSRVWSVRCEMGHIPLNAGWYYVNVNMGDRTGSVQFTRAISIHVLEHDVFGWGQPLPSRTYWGPMYWAPSWDIRPLS